MIFSLLLLLLLFVKYISLQFSWLFNRLHVMYSFSRMLFLVIFFFTFLAIWTEKRNHTRHSIRFMHSNCAEYQTQLIQLAFFVVSLSFLLQRTFMDYHVIFDIWFFFPDCQRWLMVIFLSIFWYEFCLHFNSFTFNILTLTFQRFIVAISKILHIKIDDLKAALCVKGLTTSSSFQ